jgi:hypothetical protein
MPMAGGASYQHVRSFEVIMMTIRPSVLLRVALTCWSGGSRT